MAKKKKNAMHGSNHPPAWLEQALSAAGGGGLQEFDAEPGEALEEVLARCREATEAAWILTKLRSEEKRVGFAARPLHEYLDGLACKAKVKLEPVLGWFGIDDASQPSARNAEALGRLAREVGLSLRQALVQIRLGFLKCGGEAGTMLPVAARRAEGGVLSQIEACEAALERCHARCSPEKRRELERVETGVHAAYAAYEESG